MRFCMGGINVKGRVWKLGDHVSTDLIAPGRLFHLRSNLPELAKHVFEDADPELAAKIGPGDFVVAGVNFGCGSSREHAPTIIKLAGVAAVLAKSFARIHRQNLINFGILPLKLTHGADYDRIDQLDDIEIPDVAEALRSGAADFELLDRTNSQTIQVTTDLSDRERQIVLAGGRLNYIKSKAAGD